MLSQKELFSSAVAFLKKSREEGKVTNKDIALAIGCSERQVQRGLSPNQEGGFTVGMGDGVAAFFGMEYSSMLDLGQWILSGGDPGLWTTPPSPMERLNPAEQREEVVSLRFHPDVSASAGTGFFNYDETAEVMTFQCDFLSQHLDTTNYKNLHIIQADGNSMQGTIGDGDILFVDTKDKALRDGKIFVLIVDGLTKVKRVELRPYGRGILLKSDNKDYEPILVTAEQSEQLIVVGRVVGNINKL